MSSNKGKRPRKILGYEVIYLSYETDFNVDEYVQNPPMIKKLHEEKENAHAYSSNLVRLLQDKTSQNVELELQTTKNSLRLEEAYREIEKQREEKRLLDSSLEDKIKLIEGLQEQKHSLEIELIKKTGKLDDISRNSLRQFLVSTIATVLLGFGVNIVTTLPNNWTGWVLIATSFILGIVAFAFARKSK